MIGEFVLRVAMLTAVDAGVPSVTALSAIGRDAQAMLRTGKPVPALSGVDGLGRTGGYTGALHAGGTRIKALGRGRERWEVAINQDRGAPGYPGAIPGMDLDAKDTGH